MYFIQLRRGEYEMNAHRLHAASKRRRVVYREKFILVTAAVLIAVLCSIFAVRGMRFVQAKDSSDAESAYRYYKSIELKAGDTLWDIAETYADACSLSVPEYVQELKAINGLRGDLIHEGQHLTIVYCDNAYR